MMARIFEIVVQASADSEWSDFGHCSISGLDIARDPIGPTSDDVIADVVVDDGDGIRRFRTDSILTEISPYVMLGKRVESDSARARGLVDSREQTERAGEPPVRGCGWGFANP